MKQHLTFCQTPGQILPPLTPQWIPLSSAKNIFWDFHMGQSYSSLIINSAAAGNACRLYPFLKWINCLGKCRRTSWASLKCFYVRDRRWNIYYLHQSSEESICLNTFICLILASKHSFSIKGLSQSPMWSWVWGLIVTMWRRNWWIQRLSWQKYLCLPSLWFHTRPEVLATSPV